MSTPKIPHRPPVFAALALLLALPLDAAPGDPTPAGDDEVALPPLTLTYHLQGEDEEPTWQEALAGGRSWVKLRYRYETVDDGKPSLTKDAHASTLRTVLGSETGVWKGFSVLMEAEDVSEVGDTSYNSTVNGRTDRPVVADPDGTEVNQAYLQYGGWDDTSVRVGRQRIIFANARFVGNVGWRQNEQTFDAWSVTTEALEGFTLTGAFVTNVNRINGESHPQGDLGTNTALLHLVKEFDQVGTLNAYYYDLDMESAAVKALSTSTIGASFDGRVETDSVDFLYRAEFADQSDTADNPVNVDAGYTNLELGADLAPVVVKVGFEVLEGSGAPGDKFTTPLATGHAFNGWADKFLDTPDDGLEDGYVSVGGNWAGTDLLAVYHDFSSDTGGMDYGTEIDLRATRKFECGVTGGVKFADYSTDGYSNDTTKAWVWLSYSF